MARSGHWDFIGGGSIAGKRLGQLGERLAVGQRVAIADAAVDVGEMVAKGRSDVCGGTE